MIRHKQFIFLVITFICLGFIGFHIFGSVKTSSYESGYNTGLVTAKYEVFENIKSQIQGLAPCETIENFDVDFTVVEVKSERIRVATDNDSGMFIFCL